ncbi:MAG: penicillin-insensitive murein endopeptidase [Polyangiaceae bacterium]|nr:penicillin-insensitive murein endopeptidase [Polyangiaceae bacterium]
MTSSLPALSARRKRLVPALLASAMLTLGCGASPTPLAPNQFGSVGAPHHGVLTHSAELPVRGKGFRRFRPRSPVYHGLPRLVKAVEEAAADVKETFPQSSPLVIGDLSAKTGGKIPRHNSHRSGRDVDLLFYVTSPSGIPRTNPGFYSIRADGFVRFPDKSYGLLDLPRNWHLIQTLLQDPSIDVQFMFMSRNIEARIIEYALAKEDDLNLIWRAQTVMFQPGDSLPHADHIHLRIACTPLESIHGCLGGGPRWSWYPPLPRLDLDSPLQLSELIGSSDPLPPPLKLAKQ